MGRGQMGRLLARPLTGPSCPSRALPQGSCLLLSAPPDGHIDQGTSGRARGRQMRSSVLVVVLALAMSGLVSACGTATTPCGAFTFTGGPNGARGVNATVSFAFAPGSCSAPATNATQIAYVQIVRIRDQNTGAFLAPSTEQFNRIVMGRADATQNGWAVDRLATRVWGFYGRNDDGTFASTLTPGSSSVAAVLRDSPSGWPDQSWFDAVSVPVCLQGDASCVNQLTSFYYWLFIVGTGGTTGNPVNEIGVTWTRDSFDQAVIEWNNEAAGLGKNTFPAFSRMP